MESLVYDFIQHFVRDNLASDCQLVLMQSVWRVLELLHNLSLLVSRLLVEVAERDFSEFVLGFDKSLMGHLFKLVQQSLGLSLLKQQHIRWTLSQAFLYQPRVEARTS